MNSIATTNTEISATKLKTLSFVDNGIIVTKNNKEVTTILFSDLSKVYIHKCKFSFLNKIGLFSALLIITSLLITFLPIEQVFIVSIIYIPLIDKMNTYKRYQLHLQLYDGTFYSKEFNSKTKQEHITYVNTIRKEIFNNQIIKSKENIRM